MNDLRQQFYEMLMESQYWSAAQLVDYQRSQLEQLLRHARKNVPFYERRLGAVFRRDGSIDWDRWGELPIVRRSDLVEHKEALRAKVLPPGHGGVGAIQTSGSTGMAVEILVTELGRLANTVPRWRAGDWHALDYSQDLCMRHGDDPDNRPPHGKQGGPWGPPHLPAAARGRTFTMGRAWGPSDGLDFVAKIGSPYLAIGNPKAAQALAYEAERQDRFIRIPTILVSGEKAGGDDRAKCAEIFGAELIELYSSKEGGHIAHLCANRSGFHVNAERLLVELLDDKDHPVPPGMPGRVIITPFYSTAQPLIRYDQGDMARWGTCSCGRTLPYLEAIDGRVNQMFRHPDGRRVHKGMPEEMRAMLDARLWQFAQVGPTTFEVRYVPRDWSHYGDETAVAATFRAWYFDDAEVRFRRVDDIARTSAGKFMEYVYEAG